MAIVVLDQDTAWRRFSKGMTVADAHGRAVRELSSCWPNGCWAPSRSSGAVAGDR